VEGRRENADGVSRAFRVIKKKSGRVRSLLTPRAAFARVTFRRAMYYDETEESNRQERKIGSDDAPESREMSLATESKRLLARCGGEKGK